MKMRWNINNVYEGESIQLALMTARPINSPQRFAISIIFCVAYGRRIKTLDDDIVVRNLKTDGCKSFQLLHASGPYAETV